VEFEHRNWRLTRNDIRAATGAASVFMINDVEAAALMVPHLSRYDLIELRPGSPVPHGNKALALCGAGTSMAGLVHAGGDWVPVTGKGNLASFPLSPSDPAGIAAAFSGLLPSRDEIFSGHGLVTLYRALAGEGRQQIPGARQIAAVGLSGEDPIAVQSLQVMAGWLGRMAGDMALLYGARDGVYLGGGLAANIVPALQTGHFEEAFVGTGRRAAYLQHVAVRIVKMSADASMRGAALALGRSSTPHRALHHALRAS